MSGLQKFEQMIGHTMTSAIGAPGQDVLAFQDADGSLHRFYHMQDCCESVAIAEVIGDLSDLVGSPIVEAEEVSSDGAAHPRTGCEYPPDSYTWTFYKFTTAKGTVTVRWLGESNGYYGEGVDYEHREGVS